MNLDWENVDWELLSSLRGRFLGDSLARAADYWRSDRELEHYALCFAPRIGWKWDAVLTEAKAVLRNLEPAPCVVDWGCGTGIASARYLAHFPSSEVRLWDRSDRAKKFAGDRLRALHPKLRVGALAAADALPAAPFVLLVSHVINELTREGKRDLERAMTRAEAVFWVEPGTRADSFTLIETRERLRSLLEVVAPCPHNERCGLLLPTGEGGDWCHHFAPVPSEVFRSAHWTRFGKTLKIDLRRLPLSYLVMQKPSPVGRPATKKRRHIGRARIYKGHAKALFCEEGKVAEAELRHRDDGDLIARLARVPFSFTLAVAPTGSVQK